ncbi:MAG: YacL family protein [Candidatus Poribacteria bacterium]
MDFKFYLDKHGFPRAEVSSPYELVGLLLVSEIDRSIYGCRQLLSLIETAKSGTKTEWNGEAHQVIMTRDKAIIENEYMVENRDCSISPTCEIPLMRFEHILTQWYQFILVGQEDQLEFLESQKNNAKMAQIQAQRLFRKRMKAKKRQS